MGNLGVLYQQKKQTENKTILDPLASFHLASQITQNMQMYSQS